MRVTRRSFLGAGAAATWASVAASSTPRPFHGRKIGVTDWNLHQTGKLEAVALAASLGFDGVEVSLGRKPVGDKLPMDDAELIRQYLSEAKKHKVALAGTCLDILHVNYLKNDKLGQKWVAEAIPVTKKLAARVILLPFFGKGALQTHAEMDYVGDVLRDLAPEAEKAGIMLGLEDTISAEDNVRIIDRAKSGALFVYYDVGNSTRAGFDILKEIRWLGKKRICQFHLKEIERDAYLGQGKIDFPNVFNVIREIGYQGFLNLETSSPSGSIEDDMRRNLAYVRRLLA